MRRFGVSLLLVLALAGAAVAGSATAATTTVRVNAGEFFFKLSKVSIAAPGTVVFVVKNSGHLSHDMKINGKKTPLIKPGASATLRVVFTKAGKFKYVCTVPGHATAGMAGTFVVR